MINFTTYKIDSTKNNELNPRFSFIDFTSMLVVSFSPLKSLFNILFSIETLQIQFYNFQGQDIQNLNKLQTDQGNEGIIPFSVQLVDDFVNSFDTVLFPRDFKIYI